MTRFALAAAAALLAVSALGAAAEDSGLKIDKAWARATPGGAQTAAAYMTILSAASDRLLGVSSPAAAKAAIHETLMENGVMKMRPVGVLELAPGKAVELKPGGYHVMLMGLKAPLKAGESFPVTLTFEKAGPREVTVKIEKPGATGADHDGMMHMEMPKKGS